MFKVIAPCAIRDGDEVVRRLTVGEEIDEMPKAEADRLIKACGIEPIDKKERATNTPPTTRGRGRPKKK